MKKKLVMAAVALVMAFAALSYFAEIRVDRGRYAENGISCNSTIYWNDKYNSHPAVNSEVFSMYAVKITREFIRGFLEELEGMYFTTAHCYLSHGLLYKVIYTEAVDNNFQVSLVVLDFQYENGYNETLYGNVFYSANAAKAKFYSLCQQYYNKIAK